MLYVKVSPPASKSPASTPASGRKRANRSEGTWPLSRLGSHDPTVCVADSQDTPRPYLRRGIVLQSRLAHGVSVARIPDERAQLPPLLAAGPGVVSSGDARPLSVDGPFCIIGGPTDDPWAVRDLSGRVVVFDNPATAQTVARIPVGSGSAAHDRAGATSELRSASPLVEGQPPMAIRAFSPRTTVAGPGPVPNVRGILPSMR